jgi:hypothetical protein
MMGLIFIVPCVGFLIYIYMNFSKHHPFVARVPSRKAFIYISFELVLCWKPSGGHLVSPPQWEFLPNCFWRDWKIYTRGQQMQTWPFKTNSQPETRPMSLTFHSASRKLNTEPSIGASHQISFHFGKAVSEKIYRNRPIYNKNCM